MTSHSKATLVGGPLDGTSYETRQGSKFAPRLYLEVNGVVHLYVGGFKGGKVFYTHGGAVSVEVVS